ncbi:Rap1a/Tai family immunity protein [Nitrosococcus wardiae]|uniref:Rap1a/Tai family immunity protein n=1 Tax=Nitrosococcus wardiae TaxID=1814290 RepID=UPI001F10E2B4|nr:Rap1a/Tai family immunity protein [Nitrosococcus wardiae]
MTSGYCYGYLEGLRHAGEVANDLVTRPELWGRQLWCIPQEESLEAVTRGVVEALKAHPQSPQAGYPGAVMKILRHHYPCP